MNNIISYFLGVITGILVSIAGNYFYEILRFKYAPKKKKYLSKILKDSDSWKRSEEGLYVYERDPQFVIKINEPSDVLADRFKKFPDKEHDRICWVEVKYGEATLFGWNFIYLDGYRFFVPVPKSEKDTDGEYYDYYNLNNMEIKVFMVIGQVNYLGEKNKIKGLKNIADHLKIKITDLPDTKI